MGFRANLVIFLKNYFPRIHFYQDLPHFQKEGLVNEYRSSAGSILALDTKADFALDGRCTPLN